MRLPAVLLVILLLATRASAQVPLPVGRSIGPAIDLDLGGGRASAGHGWGFLGALGLGVYEVTTSRYAEVTATASYAPWQRFAFGLAAAFVHVETGLGLGAGAHLNTRAVWGVHAGPSLSLLHLEGQIQFDDQTTKALVLFARIPVGLITKMMLSR